MGVNDYWTACERDRYVRLNTLTLLYYQQGQESTKISIPGRWHKTIIQKNATGEQSALTGGCGELQSAEADVIESLVVENHALISVLNKLVDRERGIVWLHDSVGHLGRREHRECHHHPVRVLLPDLGDEQGAHSGASPSSQRVADLKSCNKQREDNYLHI